MTAESSAAPAKTRAIDYSKKYWWLTAVLVPIVVAVIAKWPVGGESPVAGTTYVTNMSVIENEYKLIVGQPLDDPDLKQKIQRAIELGKQHDFQDAAPIFRDVIQKAPVPALYNNLGVILQGANDSQGARQAFETALAKNSTYAAAQSNLDKLTATAVVADSRSITDRELEPNNDIFHANAIRLGTTISAAISNTADVDYYSFTTPPVYRDRIEVRIENESTTLAPYIAVFNSDRSKIGETYNGNGAGNLTYSFVSLPDTKYFAEVAPASNGSYGAYTLTVRALKAYDSYEPNDDILHASPIDMGRPIQADIMDSGDLDYYRFKTTKGSNVSVTLENRSTTLAPYIAVFNSDRSKIGETSNGNAAGNINYTFTSTANSTYFIEVATAWNTSGAYTLTLKEQ